MKLVERLRNKVEQLDRKGPQKAVGRHMCFCGIAGAKALKGRSRRRCGLVCVSAGRHEEARGGLGCFGRRREGETRRACQARCSWMGRVTNFFDAKRFLK